MGVGDTVARVRTFMYICILSPLQSLRVCARTEQALVLTYIHTQYF